MSDPAIERKAIELERKLESLDEELAAWKDESLRGRPLAKHHTQIRALDRTLHDLSASVRATLEQARDQGLRDQAVAVEKMVLEIHRLWDFLRSKLALRYVPHFSLALTGAGELAWQCFRPAHDQMPEGGGREPPLVFFNGASSPLTIQRGRPFDAEAVELEPVSWDLTRAALDVLPVPVIGIPWFQVEHVPDLPIVAHEVGHDVEADLRLSDEVEGLLDRHIGGIDLDRQSSWYRWSEEVFADVYGTLALGPAFAQTLFDFLAATPETLAAELPDERSRYPSTVLRLLLSLAVLELVGFGRRAAELRDTWRLPAHRMECYEADVPVIVRALVCGPYDDLPEGRLDRLIRFTSADQRQAEADAGELLKGVPPAAADARVLVASARIAFDCDPVKYRDKEADRKVLEQIRAKQGVGVRAGPPADGAQGGAADAAATRRDADAGVALFDLMRTSVAPGGG